MKYRRTAAYCLALNIALSISKRSDKREAVKAWCEAMKEFLK